MPRISAEARTAAHWQGGGQHPKPPSDLSNAAKAVWREIVDCRPVDFFRPGALHLLEQLCVATVAARHVAKLIEDDPANPEYIQLYSAYMQRCGMHCQKLRLSIQSAVRLEDGKLDEKEETPKGKKDNKSVLFGGNVVRL